MGGSAGGGTMGWPDGYEAYIAKTSDPAVTSLMKQVWNDVDTANNNNPYLEAYGTTVLDLPYDPDTDLTDINNRLDSVQTYVDGFSAVSNWNTIIEQILSKARGSIPTGDQFADPYTNLSSRVSTIISEIITECDTIATSVVQAAVDAINDTVITNEVDAFESRNMSRHMRGVNRIAMGFADANAVNSSAFLFALASHESEFDREVGEYSSKLSREMYTQMVQLYAQIFLQLAEAYLRSYVQMSLDNEHVKEDFIQQGVAQLSSFAHARLQGSLEDLRLNTEFDRLKIIAKSEEDEKTRESKVLHSTWNLELDKYMMQAASSPIGAGAIPHRAGRIGSALGGAIAGAKIGSALPIPGGTLIGGGIGALAGAFS